MDRRAGLGDVGKPGLQLKVARWHLPVRYLGQVKHGHIVIFKSFSAVLLHTIVEGFVDIVGDAFDDLLPVLDGDPGDVKAVEIRVLELQPVLAGLRLTLLIVVRLSPWSTTAEMKRER